MRVMYVAGNPGAERTLQIVGEIQDLQEQLDRGVGADPIDFRPYPHLAVTDLARKVAEVRPDVLHIAAHGDGESLVLRSAGGSAVAVDGRQIADVLLALAVKPKLVVVNACESDVIAAAIASARAADFVIGTDASISNNAARAMTVALYQRLADAASIADAFAVAKVHLELAGRGAVAVSLHPAGATDAARTAVLVDRLRIVAQLPAVEAWLNNGLCRPGRPLRPAETEVRFGFAGVPAAARQTNFFTDNTDILTMDRGEAERIRSQTVRDQPCQGEIWLRKADRFYGDMDWYVAITTTDRRIVSASSTTAQALRRFYVYEKRRGDLPPAIAAAVDEAIACLASRKGEPCRGGTKAT